MDLSPYCVKKNTLCPAVCSVCTELAGLEEERARARRRERLAQCYMNEPPMLHLRAAGLGGKVDRLGGGQGRGGPMGI